MTSAMTVTGLTFTYPGGREAVIKDLHTSIQPGEVVALMGPSGRGKSTLLYLLGLLLTPDSGEIHIGDQPTSFLSDAQRSTLRACHIGFVFQDAQLDPARTILDAVIEPALYSGYRRRDVETRARHLLAEFGVAERADHRPGEISGGQAQRVALCRALVNQPRIVLADEPTGNLDRGNAQRVLDHLVEAARARKTALVIATHDPFVLARVDTVKQL